MSCFELVIAVSGGGVVVDWMMKRSIGEAIFSSGF
jgi:hypothetical protein